MLFAFPLGGITSAGELEKFVGEITVGVGHGGGGLGVKSRPKWTLRR